MFASIVNEEMLGVLGEVVEKVRGDGEKEWGEHFGVDSCVLVYIYFSGCPGFSDPLLTLEYSGNEKKPRGETAIDDINDSFETMDEGKAKKFYAVIEKLWKISSLTFAKSVVDSEESAYMEPSGDIMVCVNINMEDYFGDELPLAVRQRLKEEREDAEKRRLEYLSEVRS